MMRREFPARIKLAAYQRSLGVIDGKPHCEVVWDGKRCGKLILGLPEYDHVKPDGLGGEPTLENCQVACGVCHKRKTHTEDRPIMAKADRQKKSGAGIKRKYHWPKRKLRS
jgi:5-methylcytosine-specific restriction endonuclease McrA